MKREELAKLAHDCGLTDRDLGEFMTDYGYSEESITKFAAAIRAATKEEDAKIVEPSAEHRREPNYYIGGEEGLELLDNAAKDIRASK